MEQLEMVRKLHEKAGVSYDEARDALVRANWDMLEAVRFLEEEGKIAPLVSSMTTFDENSTKYEEVRATAAPGRKAASGFWDKAAEIVKMLCTSQFLVNRKGVDVVRLPLIVALFILIGMFQFVVVCMVVGLFFDCKYSVEK